MMHWTQEFDHCSQVPTFANITHANKFKEAVMISAQCVALRKVNSEQVDTISKAASPGKLKKVVRLVPFLHQLHIHNSWC